MKVLFIEVDTDRPWAVASIGPAFLAASLRAAGHTSELFRATVDHSPSAVLEVVRDEAPDLIGFSLTTRQWGRARDLAAFLRQHGDWPVVAGGLHPTFAPEAVLASAGFDAVCLGEGDHALVEYVEHLAGRGPPPASNVWLRGGTRPPLREPFQPIDGLPFLARDHLDEHRGIVHMSTQRGCPFPCTYCAARMYDELYESNGQAYGRRRSVENVMAELHAVGGRRTSSYVIFLDDTFTLHHPWVRAFCERYRDEIGVPFSLHARVETVNQRLLETLAAAGCSHVVYGVESGSARVRRDIMERYATNERFIEVFDWTRQVGIRTTANYMLGLPGETPEDLDETLALAERLDAFDFAYFVFYPYPGTRLFQVCRDKGYLPTDWLDRPANHRESILSLPTLTSEHIQRAYDRFTELRAVTHARRGGSSAFIHTEADCG